MFNEILVNDRSTIDKKKKVSANRKPVYISLTSMFNRQQRLYECLFNLLKQSYKPDKIYIYLSEDPSFFDNGFINKKITYQPLLSLLNKNKIFNILWGKDIGPYGKLLPLLKIKWSDDCLIITVDDDTVYDFNLIKNLVEDYKKYNCVISYRGFKPSITDITELKYNVNKGKEKKNMFNFPTGKGGILYHPTFFHKTGDLIFNEDVFKNICKTADDVWFLLVRIANKVECYLGTKKWFLKDNHAPIGLYTINNKNNCYKNNKQITDVVCKFKELGYL